MSTIEVRQALEAPIDKRGQSLLTLAEDQWFDRKSARIHPRDLADAEIAMANAEGGILVVGLHGGAVEGIGSRHHRVNEWRQAALDFSVPPVRAQVTLIDCLARDGESDQLLVVEVEPSTRVHANQRDEVLLRVGDENRRLSFEQRQELLYEKGQASFEASVVADAPADALDDVLLRSYAEALGHTEPDRLMKARGLMTAAGELTVGGLLLFGHSPQSRFPEATVRILRHRGRRRETGRRQGLVSDVRLEGPIPRLLSRAREELLATVPTRRALAAGGRFENIGIVPQDAWMEALVNAVVHRAYSVAGDHIRVEVFDDRIEVTSPGRFPGLVDISDPLNITRFARNPRIARVCGDLRFGQELGEGIRRIFEEMRLAGLADPSYRQTAGSVHLTLLAAPVDRALEDRMPRDSRAVLRLLRDADRASTGELVAGTGLSRPVVLRRLKALREAGLIEWVGNSPKDPRAFWRVSLL